MRFDMQDDIVSSMYEMFVYVLIRQNNYIDFEQSVQVQNQFLNVRWTLQLRIEC